MPGPISTIVAATDFSFAAHRAVRRAGMLAKAHGAALELVHVIDASSAKTLLLSSTEPNSSGPNLEERVRSEAKRSLESLADDVIKAGGVVTAQLLREGAVRDEIVAAAARSDLLVLGPRGINPVRDFLLGTTAERMARMVPCPMLVVKQDPQISYDHVLVPVDFSRYSAPALKFAAELAPDATLHVFHVVDSSLHGTLQRAGVSADAITAYREGLVREAKASLAVLTAGLPDRTLSLAEAGDARLLISEHATRSGCTLIVMGKQGRSWLAEHLIGSVTRLVLERATCDVVVVPES
jgi:nucleotide-binding universal stress UspA family protein